MITANGNTFDLMEVAELVPVSIHGMVTPAPSFSAKSGSEQVIWGSHCQSYD